MNDSSTPMGGDAKPGIGLAAASQAGPWGATAAAAESTAGPAELSVGQGGYSGGFWRLAWMMLRGVFLTVITFGFYRFWLRTDLRRHYWNSVRIDGEPFEYTGRALEMFIGFLIAIVFLAVYLFLISAALGAYSLAVWQNLEAALLLPLLAVVPLIPFAKYRAQRYLLSRTRFHGIRFGLEPGAWAYAGRSLIWTLAIICSLGLLWPVADFKLRRFVTNHTYFGDQRFSLQGGPGQLVRRFFLTLVAPGVVMIIAVGLMIGAIVNQGLPPDEMNAMIGLPVMLAGLVMFICWSLYSGHRLRFFLNRTHVGEDLILSSALSPAGLLGRAIGGYFLTGLVLAGVMVGLGVLAGVVATALNEAGIEFPDPFMGLDAANMTNEDLLRFAPIFAVVLAVYLLIYVIASAVSEVFVTRRIVSHIASTLTIEHFDRIDGVRQREEDHSRSADGFADALDVGPI